MLNSGGGNCCTREAKEDKVEVIDEVAAVAVVVAAC
jgi:hypothetical protein